MRRDRFALFRIASLIIGGGAEPGGAAAAGHAGVAYGITGLLRALPWHSRAGQVYLPADILGRHGVTREDIVTGRGGPGLRRLRGPARPRPPPLAAYEAGRPTIAPAARTAFLPMALVEPYLTAMDRTSYDPLHTPWTCRAGAGVGLWRASRTIR